MFFSDWLAEAPRINQSLFLSSEFYQFSASMQLLPLAQPSPAWQSMSPFPDFLLRNWVQGHLILRQQCSVAEVVSVVCCGKWLVLTTWPKVGSKLLHGKAMFFLHIGLVLGFWLFWCWWWVIFFLFVFVCFSCLLRLFKATQFKPNNIYSMGS